jgi:hypothetical protein
MPLDPSIVQGLQPIGIAPPDNSARMNQLAMLMKMRSAQQEGDYNSLRMQDTREQMAQRNALLHYLGSGVDTNDPAVLQRIIGLGGSGVVKDIQQARTAQTQGLAAGEELFGKTLGNAKQILQNTPNEQIPQFMAGILHDKVLGEKFTQLMPAENWAAYAIDAARDPAKAEAFKKGFLLTPAEEYKRAHDARMEGFRATEVQTQRDKMNQPPDEIRAAQAYVALTPEQQAAYATMNPQKATSVPASVQEAEWYKNATPEQRAAFAATNPQAAAGNAPMTLTEIEDPTDKNRMLRVDARVYKGGGPGSPGVVGLAGKTPSAAKAEEASQAGQELFTNTIEDMKAKYLALKQLGGIVSTAEGGMTNMGRSAASSSPGQFVGRMAGTNEQALRDEIASSRTRLLAAMKQATGMSAKQMDSNVELKLWLDSVTNPSGIYEANMAILDNLDNFVKSRANNAGSGGGANTGNGTGRPPLGTFNRK